MARIRKSPALDARRTSLARRWTVDLQDFLAEHRDNPKMAWPLKSNPRRVGEGQTVVNKSSGPLLESADRRIEQSTAPLVITVEAANGHLDGAELQARFLQLQKSFDRKSIVSR